MPKLTLYRKDGSCSIAAHILLRELNIPFIDRPVEWDSSNNLKGVAGTTMSRDDFLKLNPTGFVPVLVVDETVITELSAVLFFITSLAPERCMMGEGMLRQAKTLEWMSWLSTTLNEYGFCGVFRPSRMLGQGATIEAIEAVRAEGMRTLLKAFARIDETLARDGEYSVGGNMTVVDIMLHTFWRWGREAGIDMNQYRSFEKLVRKVEKLESVREVLEIERVPLQFP